MRKSTESLSLAYNPKEVETKWYAFWEKEGYFSPDRFSPTSCSLPPAPYVIVIPPPNVTGSLHMGHALNNTLQDALIRFKRMQGFRALWLPGTDHAGIPTQMLVERELKKEGKTRHDIGRAALISRVWEWKEKYGDIIINQLKQLGCSCDWTRMRFTMDERYTRAVHEAFIHLYKKGYIYRGNRIINWCVTCQTAVSDLEIVYRETKGKLYYFRYPFVQAARENSAGSDPDSGQAKQGSDPIYIVIATTRPETMLGDTAVAVNPEDERYANFVGKKILLSLTNREIPLISDSFVDKAFGTGAVKITPFHDPNDFEAGLRHNLPSVQVIGFNGKMTEDAGKYAGMKRYECREQILKDLEEQGLIEKIDEHTHSLSCHDRCGDVLEPLVSLQWFVKMKELAEPAIQCVKDGRVKFHPERFSKTYLDWMENIKDWCISRQIWWGHRLPVWYCEEGIKGQRDKGTQPTVGNGAGADPIYTGCQPIASKEKPSECPVCHDKNLIQDEDVLDTWFSSALWPFATLGWPDETSDVKHFYPTTTLSTARDIINLWVARMIMSGLEFMGEVPFKDVYIHPTILNEQGKRMSKSLGTGVDPLELMEKYGTDATRFGLILNCTKGQDVRFSERMIENTRNFCTKLWNASRFVLMQLNECQGELLTLDVLKQRLAEDKTEKRMEGPSILFVSERWILSRLQKTITEVTKHLEEFNFHEACQTLYEFLWGDFCDWYLEITKIARFRFHLDARNLDDYKWKIAPTVLHYVLSQTLKLLHPFLPFITEEIYKILNTEEKSIMISSWPVADKELEDDADEIEMKTVQDIIYKIRSMRHLLGVPPSQRITVVMETGSPHSENHHILDRHRVTIQTLGKCFLNDDLLLKRVGTPLTEYVNGIKIEIYAPEGFEVQKQVQRLAKELVKMEQELNKLNKRLQDEAFLKGAPEHAVQKEKERAKLLDEEIARMKNVCVVLKNVR